MAKVLCIEDEIFIRKAIVEELRDSGYETIEAGNGEEGLEAITAHLPDLVLCDITMPGMDGNQVLIELREKHPQLSGIPFVFLSALASREQIIAGKKLGADDYLTKPIDFDVLLATVEARLRQVRLMQDLRLTKEQAERANHAKTQLINNMSHELRTPLNAIIGFSELFLGETLGPLGNTEYLEYAEFMRKAGHELMKNFDDILDLANIEAGKLKLHEKPVDLANTIRSCVTLLEDLAKSGGVKIEQQIPPNLPLLRVDPSKLERILVALLTNAVKFTPRGGRASLWAEFDARRGIVITVTDNGIGIVPEDIPRALAPFSQLDGTLTRKHEGSGLGLALAKSIVELHGGSLNLKSDLGVGTEVTICLPVECIVVSTEHVA